MFSLCVYHVYMQFNEGVGLRMGDCCDPVDHVVLLDRFFFKVTY